MLFCFGKGIYLKVKDDLPEIFNKLVFYRRLKFQSEDSYAEFKNDKFQSCIQLDPIREVIALCNQAIEIEIEIEIGYYSENKYISAVHYIISEFMK